MSIYYTITPKPVLGQFSSYYPAYPPYPPFPPVPVLGQYNQWYGYSNGYIHAPAVSDGRAYSQPYNQPQAEQPPPIIPGPGITGTIDPSKIPPSTPTTQKKSSSSLWLIVGTLGAIAFLASRKRKR